jgi:hypothetical protein
MKPEHEKFLTEQCNRLKNGQCTTLSCLKRGGYPEKGKTVDVATCEAYEIYLLLKKKESKEEA